MRTVLRAVSRECLVLSAALAVFGCAGTDSEGFEPSPYSNSGERSVDGQDVNGVPASASDGMNPSPATDPSGAPSPSNEGQNPDLPIAPANAGTGTGTSPAPSSAGGPPVATSDMNAGTGETPDDGAAQPPATQPPPAPPPPAQPPAAQPPAPPPPPPPPPPLDCSAPRPNLTGGTQSCNVNAGGRVDGQSWFMWYAGSNGCMTPFAGYGGAFRANWNNSGDYLARMGQQWDETQSHDEIGNIIAELAFTRTGSAGGYSFIGVYGWSNNPLVEYYIVEDSFGNGPAVPFATTQRGTFNVDNATYRIYTGTKTNQPSIHGTATFTQVFSVRQTPRQCGRVSVSQHFRQWESMGINLGDMYEARVLVEAGGGSGSATFTTARVLVE